MKISLAIPALCLLFICLLSCKKEPDYYYIPADIKQSFATLKKGSYWIYEDSLTGKIDSFAIDGDADAYFAPEGPYHNVEEFGGFGMTEYGYTSVGKDTLRWELSLYSYGSVAIGCEKPAKANSMFSYVLNDPSGTPPVGIQTYTLPKLMIYGNEFNDVTFSTSSAQLSEPKSYMCVDLEHGMLIVRQAEPYFNRTLKLIRWHLVR